MNFGANFLKARIKKRMEQKRAAQLLNVSPGYLSRIETDKQKPSIDLILKASSLYGVAPGFFFKAEDTVELVLNNMPLKLDGEEITEQEMKGMIAFIRALRMIE